jgi:hypothetical protein
LEVGSSMEGTANWQLQVAPIELPAIFATP